MTPTQNADTDADVYVTREGLSIFMFWPVTDAAKEWLDDNVLDPIWLGDGRGLAVDARYAADLAQGLVREGFKVE